MISLWFHRDYSRWRLEVCGWIAGVHCDLSPGCFPKERPVFCPWNCASTDFRRLHRPDCRTNADRMRTASPPSSSCGPSRMLFCPEQCWCLSGPLCDRTDCQTGSMRWWSVWLVLLPSARFGWIWLQCFSWVIAVESHFGLLWASFPWSSSCWSLHSRWPSKAFLGAVAHRSRGRDGLCSLYFLHSSGFSWCLQCSFYRAIDGRCRSVLPSTFSAWEWWTALKC